MQQIITIKFLYKTSKNVTHILRKTKLDFTFTKLIIYNKCFFVNKLIFYLKRYLRTKKLQEILLSLIYAANNRNKILFGRKFLINVLWKKFLELIIYFMRIFLSPK